MAAKSLGNDGFGTKLEEQFPADDCVYHIALVIRIGHGYLQNTHQNIFKKFPYQKRFFELCEFPLEQVVADDQNRLFRVLSPAQIP